MDDQAITEQHRNREQTSTPLEGFEVATPVFERPSSPAICELRYKSLHFLSVYLFYFPTLRAKWRW
jgi:hypothetical protein